MSVGESPVIYVCVTGYVYVPMCVLVLYGSLSVFMRARVSLCVDMCVSVSVPVCFCLCLCGCSFPNEYVCV